MNANNYTRLTDSLERQLMAQAIQEQMQPKPGKALKALFARLASKFSSSDSTSVPAGVKHAAQ
ncbi:MAG: hypothetical protein WCY98_06255 [Castellaniella sp.]